MALETGMIIVSLVLAGAMFALLGWMLWLDSDSDLDDTVDVAWKRLKPSPSSA